MSEARRQIELTAGEILYLLQLVEERWEKLRKMIADEDSNEVTNAELRGELRELDRMTERLKAQF